MGWISFQEKFKKICPRWYGVRNEDGFHVYEKPEIRMEGFEDDYCVMKIPFEELERPGFHWNRMLQVLDRIHTSRKKGNQLQQIANMRKQNEAKEAKKKEAFDREIERFAKDARGLIIKLANESGHVKGMNTKGTKEFDGE